MLNLVLSPCTKQCLIFYNSIIIIENSLVYIEHKMTISKQNKTSHLPNISSFHSGLGISGRFSITSKVVLHVIKPEYPLPLDPDLYLGRIDTSTLVAMGYRDARTYLDDRPAGGVGFSPEVTLMNSSTPGISFRETMAGYFSMDETEPQGGAETGNVQGNELAMPARFFFNFWAPTLVARRVAVDQIP